MYLDECLCGTIKYEEYQNPYRINCGTKDIRAVTIIKEYNMMLSEMALTLCEVEVFSKKPPSKYTEFQHTGRIEKTPDNKNNITYLSVKCLKEST